MGSWKEEREVHGQVLAIPTQGTFGVRPLYIEQCTRNLKNLILVTLLLDHLHPANLTHQQACCEKEITILQ